jgi:hypothetical protein
MKWIKNLEFWCFFLLLLNLATAAADFYFRRSAVALLPLPPGQSLAGPPGITLAGRPPATATCHLVRYTSIKMLRRQAIHQEFLVFFWWNKAV